MLAIAKLRSAPADFRQFSNQADDRLAVVIIEIVPAYWPIQHHASVAATRNPIILTEFLPLRQQRRSLGRQQRNQIRLNLGPIAVAIPLLEQHVIGIVVDGHCTEVADETLMIVILNVLKTGLG